MKDFFSRASKALEDLFMAKELTHYRKKIIQLYAHSTDDEKREIADYLMNHKATAFNYSFMDKIDTMEVAINKDNGCNMYYIMRNGVKMFFPASWDAEQIEFYYKWVSMEQDEKSPHRYLTDDLSLEGKVILDIGGAEGIFAVDVLHQAAKIFIFECDETWLPPLRKTFENYAHKVVIIEKYVSNYSDATHVTLDAYFGKKEKIDLIKMDVEGEEVKVIEGAKRLIQQNDNLTLLVCAYHYAQEEQDIRSLFPGYRITPRRGYVLFNWESCTLLEKLLFKRVKPPYLRRCVLEIKK